MESRFGASTPCSPEFKRHGHYDMLLLHLHCFFPAAGAFRVPAPKPFLQELCEDE